MQTSELQRSKILVRVPNWIGDAVMTLPALRALRDALPEAEIVLLARPWVRDVFPLQELRARLIDYDTQGLHRGVRGRLKIALTLRRERFGVALLFQNAMDAALVSWMAGIPCRAGYNRDARGLLLTHPVAVPRRLEIPEHESHYYLELLKRLGLIASYDVVRQIALNSKVHSSPSVAETLRIRLREIGAPEKMGFVVGISPGAAFGTAKRWPNDYFVRLIHRLKNELAATCVLFGSPEEVPLAEKIMKEAGDRVFSLAGQTSLSEFVELAAGCDAYVTNDSGTMHLAAAAGAPTLAIFGPTNERETAPLGPRVELVVGEAECRPCKLRHCPYGHHKCMVSVTPDLVFDRLGRLLSH